MKDGTHLTGLEGTNPLGFLAALGVQVLFDLEDHQPRLWWTEDVIPHAVVDSDFDIDRVVEQALRVLPQWVESPALNPGFGTRADNTAKFSPEELRDYLDNARSRRPGNRLASALVAEGCLAGSGKVAKPTDLYFTAGQLKFLKIARTTLAEVGEEALREGLTGWTYSSQLSSLGWDVTDDRIYALAPTDPAKDKKLTNPGAEAFAILGLSRHPSYSGRMGGKDRNRTIGCAGPWRRGGTYSWPLWTRPATSDTVRSLLAQATGDPQLISRQALWYRAWGVSTVMQSTIRRSDQGGYGTFSPPQSVWSRESDQQTES